MEPAHNLVCLVPEDLVAFVHTCAAPIRQHLFTTHWTAVGQLMAALAWSAPAVVLGHTPCGMEPVEGPRMWGDVAAHCCKTIGTLLPVLPEGRAQLLVVFREAQLAGLPGEARSPSAPTGAECGVPHA
jgi:hypothetical protein